MLQNESESELTQSCPTLCDPMDCSLPGSSIHGIFQARVLEWGVIAFFKHVTKETHKKSSPHRQNNLHEKLFLRSVREDCRNIEMYGYKKVTNSF